MLLGIFGLPFFLVGSYYISKLIWRLYILWNARDPASELSHLPIPPGDFGLPVIGETITWAVQGSRFNANRRKKHGKIFSTNFIGRTMVKVTGPENVKQILTADQRTVTTIWPASVKRIVGENSIANSIGLIHKQRRRSCLKAFTHAALNSYIPQIQDMVKRRMQIWLNASDPILVYSQTKTLTFDVASQVLFGFSFPDENERDRLFQTFDAMITNIMSLPYDLPGSGFRKALKARKVIREYLDSHLKEKQERVTKMLNNGQTAAESDDKNVKNALHYIMEYDISEMRKRSLSDKDKLNVDGSDVTNTDDVADHVPFTIEELMDAVVEMMFAGYQTTSSVLTSTIINLIKTKSVREKLENEMREFGLLPENFDTEENNNATPDLVKTVGQNDASSFIDNSIPTPKEFSNLIHSYETSNDHIKHINPDDKDRNLPPITLEMLSKMPYLEQVMKETLRIMPPILGGYRMASKTIQLGEYRIPKGWTIVYNIRDTHESEWSEDMEFKPDRFSNENWKDNRESRFRWLPFGGGPRICVGKEFARLQYKIFIIEFLRTFSKVEFAKGKLPKMFAIPFLHPTDGLPVILTPRKKHEKDLEDKKMK